MSLHDSAPIAQLDCDDIDLSDESESSSIRFSRKKKFTLNDYSCSYIDNSAACSLMNTPQRVVRRPTTPKHLAASFDDDCSLTGSLHDLVIGFDSTVQHFTQRDANFTTESEPMTVVAHPKTTSGTKRDGTLWWSLISELPISENADLEHAGDAEPNAPNESVSPNKTANCSIENEREHHSVSRSELVTKRDDSSTSYARGSSEDEELEIQLDAAQWAAEAENDAQQLTRTADEAINEIQCMLDERCDENDADADADADVDGEFGPLSDTHMCGATAAHIEHELAGYRRRLADARNGAGAFALHTELSALSNGALRALCAEKDALVGAQNSCLVALLAERDELEFEKETFDRFIALLNDVERQRATAAENAAQASRLHRRSVCAHDAASTCEPAGARARAAAEERNTSASAPKRRSFSIQGLSSLFATANWSVLKSPSSASGSSTCASHSSMTQSATTSAGRGPLATSNYTSTHAHCQPMVPTPTALLSPVSTSTSVHEGLMLLNGSAASAKHIPIPLASRARPPTVGELQRLNAVLAAIRDGSAQVPALLADYILNVYAPRNAEASTRERVHHHQQAASDYLADADAELEIGDVEC